MKAIVVDDEYLALKSMVRMLNRFEVEVAGAFQDPREALQRQVELDADVAFVDIEMPELNGLELAARMQSVQPRLNIVFVTAYEQYALEAFELAAIDYLLKPLQLKRLEVTLKRLQVNRFEPQPAAEPLPVLCLFHHLSFRNGRGALLNVPWRTTKVKELLSYLIHSGDKTPAKEELLDRIWPDTDLEKSITHLHTTIYQIRQTLKNAGIPLQIHYKDGRYRIDLKGMEVDAVRWESAVREAGKTLDHAKMHQLLLNEYRGDYLETEDYDWAYNERERLKALWLEHALKNVEQLETSGLFSDAISLYQQIQIRFPENEESYFGLMRLYDKLGNSSEVHHQFDKLSRMLREDFGLKPSGPIEEWFRKWSQR